MSNYKINQEFCVPVADPEEGYSVATFATPAANFPTCCNTGGTSAERFEAFKPFSDNKRDPNALFDGPGLLGLLLGYIFV